MTEEKDFDATPSRKRTRQEQDESFYESMPSTMDWPNHYEQDEVYDYSYSDDHLLSDEHSEATEERDRGRFTAIITLLLVALTAITLAALFLKGLDTIKSTLPEQPAATSTK